jgi:Fanconi anemia group M protein
MVMTSVGEEGLDIPSVDLVVFFEPVPSAIRSIQRKGRTGRLAEGKVIVLATQGTRDEAYKWSSFRKEKNMYSHLKTLKKEMPLLEPQKTLQEYKEEVTIYADHREKNSRALKYLIDKGVKLELKQLEVADYILSDNVGVEIKTVPDFVNSILDGRLLEQLKDLKYNFKNPLLIVEGEEDLYSVRNVHPNAIRGMLATVVTTFGIPVLTTKTSPETAELLISIAKKEQEKGGSFSAHSEKRGVSLQEQQEYFVSSLPQIGGKLARELLEHFGTPQKIVNASEEELRKVEKIGEVKAKKLKEMFEKEYR